MTEFGAYVFFAMDRIEAAGPETVESLKSAAADMRTAAEHLERRAANLPGIAIMTDGICSLAISQPGAAR